MLLDRGTLLALCNLLKSFVVAIPPSPEAVSFWIVLSVMRVIDLELRFHQ